MTNEERDLITQFITRVGGAPAQSGGFASVPTAGQQSLPPIDREADQLMADLFTRYPEARYRITQLAFIQEHALVEATNRIARLTAQLQQMQQGPQGSPSPWGAQGQAMPQGQPQPSRGFFGSLFGGGQPRPQQYAPPPMQQPQYAPGGQMGMFQRGGSGFLGSALTTAAGVAGGMVAGNALMGLFEGGHHGGADNASFGGAGATGGWGTQAADPYDLGGASKGDGQGGLVDNSSWSSPAPDQGGWTDPAADQGSWTDASSDGGGWTDPGSSDPNDA